MSDLNEQLRAAFEAIAPKFGIDTTLLPAGFRKSAAEPFKYVHSNHLFAIFCEGAASATPAPQAAPSDVLDDLRNVRQWIHDVVPIGTDFTIGKLAKMDKVIATLAAAPAVAITQAATSGYELVPTEINAVIAMGFAYLDAARAADPQTTWKFSHPGWHALLAKAKEFTPALAATSEPTAWISEDAAGMLRAGRGVTISTARASTGPWSVPIYLAGTKPNTEAPRDEQLAFALHEAEWPTLDYTMEDFQVTDDYEFYMKMARAARAALSAQQAGVQEAPSEDAGLLAALKTAEAALADIGDADREPGDDLAWCEARAAKALPEARAALAAATQTEK